ncbi:MAG: hypothetical protein N4A35_10255 [Flavobacteriales bacterium]|jgi:uncharacterized protein YggE|nr:hypothetical protein [Flavobacteriales bacterium]
MKQTILTLIFLTGLSVSAQVNNTFGYSFQEQNCGIITDELTAEITTKVLYNAQPDGYIVTYTTSFIGNTVVDVENLMNKKIDSLTRKVKKIGIEKEAIAIDIQEFDPIFSIKNTTEYPEGYKVSLNLNFKLKDYNKISRLTQICLAYNIYDIVGIQPFINNTKPIDDSLALKSIELLNAKKELCKKLSWSFTGGHAEFSKCKNVFYPDEHYLKTTLKNNSLFHHNLSQNSTINLHRNLDVNVYNNLNLKDVDYIYNSEITVPVIQFVYQINYKYIKTKPKEKEDNIKEKKSFYILDKEGNLTKLKL